MSANGTKRTSRQPEQRSANDPKRTCGHVITMRLPTQQIALNALTPCHRDFLISPPQKALLNATWGEPLETSCHQMFRYFATWRRAVGP